MIKNKQKKKKYLVALYNTSNIEKYFILQSCDVGGCNTTEAARKSDEWAEADVFKNLTRGKFIFKAM